MNGFFLDNEEYNVSRIKGWFRYKTDVDLDQFHIFEGGQFHEFLKELKVPFHEKKGDNNKSYKHYWSKDLNKANVDLEIVKRIEKVQGPPRKTEPLPSIPNATKNLRYFFTPVVISTPAVPTSNKYADLSSSEIFDAVLEAVESLCAVTSKNEFNRYTVIPNIKNERVYGYLKDDESRTNFGNVMNDLVKKGIVQRIGTATEMGNSVGVWSLIKQPAEKQVAVAPPVVPVVTTTTAASSVFDKYLVEACDKNGLSKIVPDLLKLSTLEKVRALKELTALA